MKKLSILLCLFLFGFLAYQAYAMPPGILGALESTYVASSPPVSYCSGSELFCEDFEGEDTSWDDVNGTEDCDGYDANGDYCDDDTTFSPGDRAEVLGFQGRNTYYVGEAFSSADQDEFYVEGWVYFNDAKEGGQVLRILASNSTEQIRLELTNPNKYWRIETKDTATGIDSSTAPSDDTWYHYGIYYKEETGSDDGIIRMWVNTSTTAGDFDAGDNIINEDAVDTGTADADEICIAGEAEDEIIYHDNVKVVAGSPGWAYE